jgi:hypothetical protein
LARRKGLGRAGLVVAAALAGLSGFLMPRAVFPHQFASACWLAPALLALDAGSAWGVGACLALQWLAGYPPFSLMSAAALAVCARGRAGGLTLTRGAAAAAGLAAIQALPFLEFLAHSSRGFLLGAGSAGEYSLPPAQLAKALFLPQWRHIAPALDGDPSILSFYVGLPALALAAWGAFRGGRTARRLAAAGAACLALSLGRFLPGFSAAAPLHVFRYPANWLFLATAAAAALAALGVARLPGPRLRAAAAGLVLADLLAFAQAPSAAWADPAFLTKPPPLAALARADGFGRVYHSEPLLRAWAGGTLEDRSDYAAMWGLLAPSYGMAFEVGDVADFQTMRPARAEAFRARLAVAPAAERERLLDLAGARLELDLRPGASRVEAGTVRALSRASAAGRVFLTGEGAARLVSYAPGTVAAEVLARAPVEAVLAETAAPGWEALVDGWRAPAGTYEDVFVSAPVPAGLHRVEFRYRPGAFAAGAAISLTTLAWAVWSALRRRRRAR